MQQPMVYDHRNVYDNGGGGGGEILGLKFGGLVYPVAKIGTRYWTTQNLLFYDGTMTRSGTITNNSKQYCEQGGNGGVSYSYGLYYNQKSVEYIDSLLVDGWRVPFKSDIQDLVNTIGGNNKGRDILSFVYGGNKQTEFNLYAFGRIYVSTTFDFDNVAYLFSKTIENTRFQGIQITKNTDTINTSTLVIDQGAILLRLCKDV